MKKYIKFIIPILIVLAVVFGINEYANRNVAVTSYSYSNEKLPKSFDGYKLMLVSDVHNAPFEEQLIEIAEKEEPDIIVFCGDMVQLPDDKTTAVCRVGTALGDKFDIYAVSGNHETQNYSYDTIMSELKENKIKVLDNDYTYLERDGDKIILAGLKDPKDDYLTTGQYDRTRKKISKLFEDKTEFGILLNHRADMYPEINESGADLILSGHLHGGIIRIPFVGGLIGKDEKPPAEYEYGFYDGEGKSDMIVSGGCDLNPKKKRFFNPPEALVITLQSE